MKYSEMHLMAKRHTPPMKYTPLTTPGVDTQYEKWNLKI